MRLFYLICASTISLLILIVAVAQFGASCSWYLIDGGAHPVIVLLVTALLGGFSAAFFLLFLLAPKPKSGEDEVD